jgi:acetyl esterase
MLKIVTGGQTGVDRAALDVAIELGLPYGGCCPKGAWAEDLPNPPGLLALYPHLRGTPDADPAQRTEWNVRDSDRLLILVDSAGIAASKGTALARDCAETLAKPCIVVDVDAGDALVEARAFIGAEEGNLVLGIGGPRESEAPGIYAKARAFLRALLQDGRPSAREDGRASPSLKLDREAEALLHWASSAPGAPLWSLPPDEARNEYRRVLAKTEIPPPEIREAADLVVPGDEGPLRLRRYVPASGGTAAEAAILFVHGGGCVIGDIESHDVLCRTLCHDTGATVFSLDYRLAPEHPFPAAVEDTVAALQWLSGEGPSLGLNRERIVVVGDSAGGGLAAVALHETMGRLVAPVRGQALIYPALDLRGRLPSRRDLGEHFPIPRDLIQWFFGHYFGLAWPIADPRAIPALYEDYTGLPPALIITASHDPLRDEGAEYAEALAAAGVPVDYQCCEGTIHGFMNMGRVLRRAHGRTRKRIAAWLKERLGAS